MNEPTIKCPNCGTEIRLTESLAAPLIESTRRDFEKRMAQKDLDVSAREKVVTDQIKDLAKQRESLAAQVAERVQQERNRISQEEAAKARQLLAVDMQQKTKEIQNLQEVIKQREDKLAEAQKAQAEFLRKQRELEDAKRELELVVEKRVAENLAVTRQQARKEAEDELKLKVSEKEHTITAMQKQIEELKRKAEQGSQQLQGEVQELELEKMLRAQFPHDTVLPVPKGEHGGDVLQRVVSPLGQVCGTILWESKRTKNWADSWLSKLRDDQRDAKAEVSALVTQILPKGIENFGLVDGVWISSSTCVLPLAAALRFCLLETAMARKASEGQQSKMELVYQYLTGPKFKQRVTAIVEAWKSMKEDLDKEKKVIQKQWDKRAAQIDRVTDATIGMYGDLQGIAGKSIQEIDDLEFQALEDRAAPTSDVGTSILGVKTGI
jgi:hypothetical protein